MFSHRKTDRASQASVDLEWPKAQGDPLAPLLFSLVLQQVVEKIEARVPGLAVNAWYLDDGVQVGSKQELQEVMEVLEAECPGRGLVLNTLYNTEEGQDCKTTVWGRRFDLHRETIAEDFLGRGAKAITEEGFILLGAPIGSDGYSRRAVGKRLDTMATISERLELMEDAQAEYALLRSCLAVPKIMFSMRTVNPTLCLDMWEDVDELTRQTLTRILGLPTSDRQWEQAQLPVSMGRLGLRSARAHAQVAYASSYTRSAVSMAELLAEGPEFELPPQSTKFMEGLQESLGRDRQCSTSLADIGSATQRFWSLEVDLPTQAAAVPTVDAGGGEHQGHSPYQRSVPPPRWRLAHVSTTSRCVTGNSCQQ